MALDASCHSYLYMVEFEVNCDFSVKYCWRQRPWTPELSRFVGLEWASGSLCKKPLLLSEFICRPTTMSQSLLWPDQYYRREIFERELFMNTKRSLPGNIFGFYNMQAGFVKEIEKRLIKSQVACITQVYRFEQVEVDESHPAQSSHFVYHLIRTEGLSCFQPPRHNNFGEKIHN